MPLNKAKLAKIHIAKKELGLTDDAYRDILRLHFQVESAAKLNDRQATVLLNVFKTKGWKPKGIKKGGEKGSDFITVNGPSAQQQRKVLAMWNELGYPMIKLHGRVQKQFGVTRFEWLQDHERLHILITDLEQRLRSKRKNEQGRIG